MLVGMKSRTIFVFFVLASVILILSFASAFSLSGWLKSIFGGDVTSKVTYGSGSSGGSGGSGSIGSGGIGSGGSGSIGSGSGSLDKEGGTAHEGDTLEGEATSGPIAHYKFEEESWPETPSVRDSVHEDDGYWGYPQGGIQPSAERNNHYARFDGIDDYIFFFRYLNMDFDDFTISFWVKGNPGFTANTKILANTDGDSNNEGYSISVDETSGLNFKVSNWIENKNITVARLGDGTWHHVVFVVSREGTSYGYRDGVLVSTLAGGVFPGEYLSEANSLYVGSNYGGRQFFDGSLDEVQIYNRALSAEEVNTKYLIQNSIFNDLAAVCIDSDGGKNYSTPGYAQDVDESKADYCQDEILTEYSCTTEGNVTSERFTCSNACRNGACSPVSKQLLWLRFNNSLGDISGNNNHAASRGNASFALGGIGNRSIIFGNGEFLTIRDKPVLRFDGDLTIAFWMRVSTGAEKAMLIGKGNGDGEFEVWHEPSGRGSLITFKQFDGEESQIVAFDSDRVISYNVWHHIVIRNADCHLAMFVDGQSFNTGTCSAGPRQTTSPIRIGNSFTGNLDEIMLYNGELSNEEIVSLYRAQLRELSIVPLTFLQLSIATIKDRYSVGEVIELTDPPDDVIGTGFLDPKISLSRETIAPVALSKHPFFNGSAPANDSFGYIIQFKEEPLAVQDALLRSEMKENQEYIQKTSQLNPRRLYTQAFGITKPEQVQRKVKIHQQKLLREHERAKEAIAKELKHSLVAITGNAVANGEGALILGEYDALFNGIALNVSAEEAQEIATLTNVKAVSPNRKRELLMRDSLPLIGATAAWEMLDMNGQGITGKNTTIAIIDTGVDYTHPDFGSCTTEEFIAHKCNKVIDGYDFSDGDDDPMDYEGHGTHVASIAAGMKVESTETEGTSGTTIFASAESYSTNFLYNAHNSWNEVQSIDFNGDGKTDVLWQSTASAGDVAVWYRNGSSPISFNANNGATDVVPGPGFPAWRLVGAYKLNNDNDPDLLWYGSDGSVVVWYSNTGKTTFREKFTGMSTAFVKTPVGANAAVRGWKLVGAGDMDGDGVADLVWQEQSDTNPRVSIWVMDVWESAPKYTASNAVLDGVPWSSWELTGIADLDNDGKKDFVWQGRNTDYTTAGTVVVWYMNRTQLRTSGSVVDFTGAAVSVPANWKLIGMSRFDGTLNTRELLWQTVSGPNINGALGTWSLLLTLSLPESVQAGVAPDASILAYKVFPNADDFVIIHALERSIDPNQDGDFSDHADVISLSLGAPGNPNDPLSQAVDNAVAAGSVVVVAAGNSGPNGDFYCGHGNKSICSPGTARKAITVGASRKYVDWIAGFSSWGPVEWVDAYGNEQSIIKPDILAPGVDICAALYNNVLIENEERLPSCIDEQHVIMSGTSMATPMVSGAVALVRQAHPDWTPEEVKSALMSTSHDFSLDANVQGAGRIDVARAISLSSLSIGELQTNRSLPSGFVTIIGSAGGKDFSHYVFSYRNRQEDSWHELIRSSERVENGALYQFDTSLFDAGAYVLKLEVFNNNDDVITRLQEVTLTHVSLLHIGNKNYLSNTSADIIGEIYLSQYSDYTIEYREYSRSGGETGEWKTLCAGIKPRSLNISCRADLSSLSTGQYVARIRVASSEREDYSNSAYFTVVTELIPGWPFSYNGNPFSGEILLSTEGNHNFIITDGQIINSTGSLFSSFDFSDRFPTIYKDPASKQEFIALIKSADFDFGYHPGGLVDLNGRYFPWVDDDRYHGSPLVAFSEYLFNYNNGGLFHATDGIRRNYVNIFNKNGDFLPRFPLLTSIDENKSLFDLRVIPSANGALIITLGSQLYTLDAKAYHRIFVNTYTLQGELQSSTIIAEEWDASLEYTGMLLPAALNERGYPETIFAIFTKGPNSLIYSLDVFNQSVKMIYDSSAFDIKKIAVGKSGTSPQSFFIAAPIGNSISIITPLQEGTITRTIDIFENIQDAQNYNLRGIFLADIDSDTSPEIIILYSYLLYLDYHFGVQVFGLDGTLKKQIDIPSSEGEEVPVSAIVGDINNDGVIDIVFTTTITPYSILAHGGWYTSSINIYALSLGGAYSPLTLDWPMRGHDSQRSNCYNCLERPQSKIVNPDIHERNGLLTISFRKLKPEGWENYSYGSEEIIDYPLTVPARGVIKLDALFNSRNVILEEQGRYELFARFVEPSGDSVEASWPFIVV